MDRRMLEYNPEIDAFRHPAPASGPRTIVVGADEMQHAAELLERVDEGDLEGYLVELIDRGRTAQPVGRVTSALAAILGRCGATPAALQRGDARRSGRPRLRPRARRA